MVRCHQLRVSREQWRRTPMPKKKKPKPVMVDGIPIKPISPAEHRRLDRRIKNKYEKLRRRYPEVHGKKVDWISHWHEEGYLSFNVRFTDGKNFSILCSPTIVTNVVDFSDVKTDDSGIVREYYHIRDDRRGAEMAPNRGRKSTQTPLRP